MSDLEDKIRQAQEILKAFEMPGDQQGKIGAVTLLALCCIKPKDSWQSSERRSLGITTGIMPFVADFYEISYKPNTRESFRKSALNAFVENSIAELNPDNPDLKTTSSKTHYAISIVALNTIRKFGTSEWPIALENFLKYKVGNQPRQYKNVTIKQLSIRNYKSIIKEDLAFGRFNIFIGANGCGKTNILEAIALIGADKARDLSFEGMYARGMRIAKPDLLLSSFSDTPTNQQIEINATLSDGSVSEEYRAYLIPENFNDIYTKWINLANEEITSEQLLDYFRQITYTTSEISGLDLIKKANELLSNRKGARDRTFDSLLADFAIFDVNTKSLRGIAPSDSKKTPLGINGEGLDLTIASFSSDERATLNSYLYFFDWLKGVIADKDNKFKLQGLKPGRSTSTLYFKDRFMLPQNDTLSAESSNEGVLHVLFYLTLFISTKTPKLIGIDNIETALNPRLCQSLIKALVDLAKQKDKQAFVTTHNPSILDGLNLFDEDQRLFEVFRDSGGRTKTRRIKFKQDLSDKNAKLSEMWLKGALGAVPKNF
jgi:AAA15 family ATPase/GTPase